MENKKCYNCRFYKPYYTKGYFKFDKQEIGFCCANQKITEYNETCEKISNKYHVRIDRKQAALKALTENLNLLAEIKQILEEDDADDLEELFTMIRERKK